LAGAVARDGLGPGGLGLDEIHPSPPYRGIAPSSAAPDP
jgi:hypothetical protein